jgi:hypothetical protein
VPAILDRYPRPEGRGVVPVVLGPYLGRAAMGPRD